MDDLFDLVTALVSLNRLSTETVGATVGAELSERPSRNRYFHFYEAELSEGAIGKVELKEPGAGATATERILTLNVRDGVTVTEDDVSQRLGPGSIEDVMPRAELKTMGYPSDRFDVSMLFTAGRTLREITIVEAD